MTYSETTWGYAKDTTSLDKWNDVLISYAGNTITTDAIGNTLWDGLFSYTWQHGRQLARAQNSIIDVTYSYNADGIRTSKTVKNTISNTNILHTYDLDGTTIVRECIYDTTGSYVETELRYYYDAKGAPVAMHVFKKANANATPQEFVCYFATNLQGDVVALYDKTGNRIASYTYDAWGNNIYKNSTATSNISTADAQWLMNINPFRYRGYYYDTETGFYYLQSRYYNPQWGRFLNADGYINANGDLIGFNMYAYCSNNPVIHIDSSGQMWQLVPALHPRNQAEVFKGNMDGISGGYIQPRFTTAYSESSAYSTWGIRSITAYFDGMLGGYFTEPPTHGILNFDYYNVWGAISVTDDMATTNSHCFVEGTLVATENGLVPIEDIQPGDLVWAKNPETGETALKQVVQLFRNETKEWIHITVNGETITCTPEHPFYSPVKGWINAIDLRAGDILVMLNGEYIVVEQVQHELLAASETTYNFEVEDFHTYYVSKSRILTHNKCYEPFRVRDMRATINGGETEAPHAHIFKKRKSIGRIFRDGTMDSSLQNNRDGMRFVKEFFDDIMRLIDDYYGKR